MKTPFITIIAVILLAASTADLQAQQTGFEVLLSDYVQEVPMTFSRGTSDGGVILNPGIRDKLLRLDSEGRVVAEITYAVDPTGDAETRFCGFIDIPDDPSHHLAVAEAYHPDTETGNVFHVIRVDESLNYNADDVLVMDFSEEVRYVITGSPWNPRFCLEEDGCVSLAGISIGHDGEQCLLYGRISPQGVKTTAVETRLFNDYHSYITHFASRDGHYEMVARRETDFYPDFQFVNYYEVGRDFASTDSVRNFITNTVSHTLLRHESNDTIYHGWLSFDQMNVVWVSDSVFVTPTPVDALYLGKLSKRYGAGVWKLNSDFNVTGQVFFDLHDEEIKYLYSWTPLLYDGKHLFFCYTYGGPTYSTPKHNVICKLDTDLNVVWKRWFGDPEGFHIVYDFSLTDEGGCVASGTANKSPILYAQSGLPYVLKVNADGYCSVKENEEPLLKPYCFFPNPVDDQLHMEFSPDVTPRQIELYDLQGRLVSIQNNGFESVEMRQLPSGTYTIRIVMKDGTSYSDKVVKQ